MTGLPRPLELEILHHYYCISGDFPRIAAPACRAAIEWLAANGLIARAYTNHDPEWEITARGCAHLKALLEVPLPEASWITPWDKI